MPDLSWLFHLASFFPLEGMDMRFMQQALVALVLLAPMTAALGVQVVQYRMAFFSDAVGHSAFAGVGVATAVLSASMAMHHSFAEATEGIVEDDIDRTIHNLTRIGHDGMCQTDDLIIDIMTNKQ